MFAPFKRDGSKRSGERFIGIPRGGTKLDLHPARSGTFMSLHALRYEDRLSCRLERSGRTWIMLVLTSRVGWTQARAHVRIPVRRCDEGCPPPSAARDSDGSSSPSIRRLDQCSFGHGARLRRCVSMLRLRRWGGGWALISRGRSRILFPKGGIFPCEDAPGCARMRDPLRGGGMHHVRGNLSRGQMVVCHMVVAAPAASTMRGLDIVSMLAQGSRFAGCARR